MQTTHTHTTTHILHTKTHKNTTTRHTTTTSIRTFNTLQFTFIQQQQRLIHIYTFTNGPTTYSLHNNATDREHTLVHTHHSTSLDKYVIQWYSKSSGKYSHPPAPSNSYTQLIDQPNPLATNITHTRFSQNRVTNAIDHKQTYTRVHTTRQKSNQNTIWTTSRRHKLIENALA